AGRVLAHEHGVVILQRLAALVRHAVPVVERAGELDAPHQRRHRLTALPLQVLRLAGGQRVAAPLQLAHHREGAVLVGLEARQGVGDEENVHGAFGCVRYCCTKSAISPAITPQKAEPMPAMTTPLSVTRKVMSAASRCRSSCSAVCRPPPMLPSSAMPAIAITSSRGNAISRPGTNAPTRPMAPYSAPQTTAAV